MSTYLPDDDLRITSTYVENTTNPRPAGGGQEDHLHIRGEYSRAVTSLKMNGGSPPHTWRIPAARKQHKKKYRITSTYVENTFSICCLLARLRDHLHIRGEYFGVVQLVHITKGSPPHTWRILLIKVF